MPALENCEIKCELGCSSHAYLRTWHCWVLSISAGHKAVLTWKDPESTKPSLTDVGAANANMHHVFTINKLAPVYHPKKGTTKD